METLSEQDREWITRHVPLVATIANRLITFPEGCGVLSDGKWVHPGIGLDPDEALVRAAQLLNGAPAVQLHPAFAAWMAEQQPVSDRMFLKLSQWINRVGWRL